MTNPERMITPHQLELIALVSSGYSQKEIAEVKFLARTTVSNNLAAAVERTGARNTTHLCMMCFHTGLLKRQGQEFVPVQEEGVIGE